MRPTEHNTTALPRRLREELGIPEYSQSNRTNNARPGSRKELRKAARIEKRIENPTRRVASVEGCVERDLPTTARLKSSQENARILENRRKTKHISSKPKAEARRPQRTSDSEDADEASGSASPIPREDSRGFRAKLEADDAEIAALEKALGVKGKKTLPKSFNTDGLDVLLDGLEDNLSVESHKKRKRDEGELWLEAKRQKARKGNRQLGLTAAAHSSEDEENADLSEKPCYAKGELENSTFSFDSLSDDGDGSKDSDESTSSAESAKKRIRENPYRAPVTATVPAPKYIPPSLRNQVTEETGDVLRLRRQLQGLINRLSDSNLISILSDVEVLYRNSARHQVSTLLTDLLLGLLCDPAVLQDTFVILHAGFITALYKTVGSDFGAQVVQRMDEEFHRLYEIAPDQAQKGKNLTNLISLASYLYTFQMVGSNLMYDYIKLFIKDFSEDTAELLLKCVRISGPQLRHDDPTALKEIVLLVQTAVSVVGEDRMSVRTKFMVETINNLKNNRIKTGIAGSEVISEHVIRTKKTIGSLNTRNLKATEPLKIGLRDVRESDKKGRWWLVGARDRGQNEEMQRNSARADDNGLQNSDELALGQSDVSDLLQTVREQGMNTDVRRSIFIGIMSATDYDDAFQRLLKLRLKRSQQLEIPKVIVHCAGAEDSYNPYYTLLARRACSDRKLQKAFQFSLWNFFKRLGEVKDDDQDNFEERDEEPSMRSIVNLAKLFGSLIAEGVLSLSVLKILNFPYLQPKSRSFVELMVITVILFSQRSTPHSRDRRSIERIFMQATSNPRLAKGLQYFLKKTVSRTDIAGNGADKEIVKWGSLPRASPTSTLRPLIATSTYAFYQPKIHIISRHNRGYATEADQHDLVIIGGGVAGYVAAIKAGQEGLKVACIEKRGALGGTCLNVGCIPSKSLLNNSHMYHQILHDTKKRGIEVGDVKLNLKQMMAAKDTSVQGLTKGVEFLFKKNNVEYIAGTGAFAGENEVKVNKISGGEATLLAKNILIATGSEATPFPGLTIDEKKVVTSTGAIALDKVPGKMVVIGGGIIGLEMGSVWSRLGADVTVVEFLGQIGGPGMDAEISKTTQKILGKQGMKFKLNTKVISGDDSGEGVKLEVEAAKGGKKETLDADVVLVAIGRRPYTAGLGLENIGLDVDNKGRLVIDEQYRTKLPHIRVIGDCTFGPMLAHKAEEEAVAAIEYITKGHGHVNYGAIPSVMYTHPEVAWVGQNEAELKEQGVKYRVGTFPFSANSRAKTNLETEGIVKFISDAETDRILGIHIVGPNAGEMIAEGVLAVEYGASSEDVARTSHAHPTLAEAFKEAAMATYSKAIHY
ncbi:MAG: hypothetical protein Q9219_001026 [cf. Caloplaca sp. 3 TL-2023]